MSGRAIRVGQDDVLRDPTAAELVAANPSLGGTGGGVGLPISDALALLKDDIDATKLLRFELGGFTTGFTRVMTFPDANCTIARANGTNTFTGTQTFTGSVQNAGSGNFNWALTTGSITLTTALGAVTIGGTTSATFQCSGTGSAILQTTGSGTATVQSTGAGVTLITSAQTCTLSCSGAGGVVVSSTGSGGATLQTAGGVAKVTSGSGGTVIESTGGGVTTITSGATGSINKMNIGPTAGQEGTGAFTTLSFTTSMQLQENAPIALRALQDLKYCGITDAGVSGEALTFGDLVYLKNDSRWWRADADADATAGAVALAMAVTSPGAAATAMTVLRFGKIRADTKFPSFTVGAPVYVSTNPGEVQTAQPSGTDDVIRIVGHGTPADELFFNPSNDYLTHT